MKKCARCGINLASSEFNTSVRSGDGLQSYCRACQKQHYLDNRDRHLANVRRTSLARKARMRVIVREALVGGCVDCGNTDIRVLEFDHVRGEKIWSVSEMVTRGSGMDVLLAEIAKCEVRCRNCHVIKTFHRMGGTWRDYFA